MIVVQLLRSLLDRNQHSYKCLLRACICFNDAIFHIFSGPLFANLEGYVYLDLMIWGLSPLAFLALKGSLTQYLREAGGYMRPDTLRGMILCCCVLCLSYPFLNYSQYFNWNYFSRTFNLDMGYFVFDFLLRTFDLLIELEEQDKDTEECSSYCTYQFGASILAYSGVYVFSSALTQNERNNGPKIFALSCLLSLISVLLIPIVYYSKHQELIERIRYQEVLPDDELPVISEHSEEQLLDQHPSTIRQALGVVLLTSSLLLNMNYFSLWLMEPLGARTEETYLQYNKTVHEVSWYFLLSMGGFYGGYRMFRANKVLSGCILRIFLMAYGGGLILCYWVYEVELVGFLMLGFGVHQICVMEFRNWLEASWKFGMKFYLYNEVFVYFVLPLIYTLLNVGQTSLKAYALTSGLFMLVGAILV